MENEIEAVDKNEIKLIDWNESVLNFLKPDRFIEGVLCPIETTNKYYIKLLETE